MAPESAVPFVGQPGTPRYHCSVEWRPLLAVDPRGILPVPLHTTQGDKYRYLRLPIDMVIVHRRATDGSHS